MRTVWGRGGEFVKSKANLAYDPSTGIGTWVEFVKSGEYLADDPSREDMDWAEELGAERIDFTMPPVDRWG